MGDWMVGPDHVLSDAGGLDLVVRGSQGTLTLKNRDRVSLATDMVAIKFTAADWSKIGAQIAPIGQLEDTQLVNIVGPAGRGTTGGLRNDNIFGCVEYDGTTAPGYSGCGYFYGSKLMGIHQRGGAINGGIAAEYLKMMLDREDKIEEESDYLVRFLKNQKKYRVRTCPGSADELEIEAGGKYFTRSYEKMETILGSESLSRALSAGYYQASSKVEFSNVPGVPESSVFPTKSGVSSSPGGKPEPQANADLHQLIGQLSNLSKGRLNEIRKLVAQSTPTQGNSAKP